MPVTHSRFLLGTALRDVLALLERATPGRLEVWTSCSWRRVMAGDETFIVPTVDRDGHPNMDRLENVEAAAAAVNFLREHAAALTSALPVVRWCVSGVEVTRDDAYFAWRSSDTYRNAARRDEIWPAVEAGFGGDSEFAHLREAGVTVKVPS